MVQQLTNFVSGGEAAPAAAPGRRRGANASSGAAAGDPQEQWLIKDQLQTMQVIRERKEQSMDASEAHMKAGKGPGYPQNHQYRG